MKIYILLHYTKEMKSYIKPRKQLGLMQCSDRYKNNLILKGLNSDTINDAVVCLPDVDRVPAVPEETVS